MPDLNERKREIVNEILKVGELSIAELEEKTGIPRSSLNHHLDMLSKDNVISQKREGRKVINRVNPVHIQKFRKEFNIEAPKLLITGYTFNPELPDERTLQLAERAVKLLKSRGEEVEKCITFTTYQAQGEMDKREYLRGGEEVVMDIKEYQSNIGVLEEKLKLVIEEEIIQKEIIIDLTPLTKLFTIACLSLARDYKLKSVYHGGEKLIWV